MNWLDHRPKSRIRGAPSAEVPIVRLVLAVSISAVPRFSALGHDLARDCQRTVLLLPPPYSQKLPSVSPSHPAQLTAKPRKAVCDTSATPVIYERAMHHRPHEGSTQGSGNFGYWRPQLLVLRPTPAGSGHCSFRRIRDVLLFLWLGLERCTGNCSRKRGVFGRDRGASSSLIAGRFGIESHDEGRNYFHEH